MTNNWVTGSRTEVRLCPNEGDSGTSKNIEIQEEGVCSLFLNVLKCQYEVMLIM